MVDASARQSPAVEDRVSVLGRSEPHGSVTHVTKTNNHFSRMVNDTSHRSLTKVSNSEGTIGLNMGVYIE